MHSQEYRKGSSPEIAQVFLKKRQRGTVTQTEGKSANDELYSNVGFHMCVLTS